MLSKRGISQYTVDLKFETKRLNSKLFGYISTTDSSVEASLYTDYKFYRIKEQRFSIKFGFANKSPQNMIVLVGFCKLNSTSYPNLNIDSNATFKVIFIYIFVLRIMSITSTVQSYTFRFISLRVFCILILHWYKLRKFNYSSK